MSKGSWWGDLWKSPLKRDPLEDPRSAQPGSLLRTSLLSHLGVPRAPGVSGNFASSPEASWALHFMR